MIIAYSFKHEAWAGWMLFGSFFFAYRRMTPYCQTLEEAKKCKPRLNPQMWKA